MLRVALDTNAYRALFDGNSILAEAVRTATSIGLPTVVMAELYFGIFNGSQMEKNSLRLQRFLESQRTEVLHINQETAKIFGEIATELKRNGKPIQQNDIWIAALCKQHNYMLFTADKGFSQITGLELLSF